MMYSADAMTNLWGKRKLWMFHAIHDSSPARKKLVLWKAWKPSPAQDKPLYLILNFSGSYFGAGMLKILQPRKPWAMKANGFLSRTHKRFL